MMMVTMVLRSRGWRSFAAAAVLAACEPGRLCPQETGVKYPETEVYVFLSSEISPYSKAAQGFQDSLGRPVVRRVLAEAEEPAMPGMRVAVVFGGKAARMEFPRGVEKVVCLAPSLRGADGGRARTRVEMLPEPDVLVGKIRALQPGLRVLAALWAAEQTEPYLEGMVEAGKRHGLEVRPFRAEDGKELYKTLRDRVPPDSAIWVSPDPLLINVENFAILKEYSFAKAVPLYVPTRGLAEGGGAVSISVGFAEMGRIAAEVTRKLLEGGNVPKVVYPEKVEVSLNRAAARRSGLNPSKKALEGVAVFN